jgi:HD superfamily phosphodiesterase
MDDRELGSIRDIARQLLGNATFSGLDHAERVRQIAEDIGQREGADLDTLRVASLLRMP